MSGWRLRCTAGDALVLGAAALALVGSIGQGASGGPDVIVRPESINAGDVPNGARIDFEATLQSASSGPETLRVVPSCRCLLPEQATVVVSDGAKVPVRFVLDMSERDESGVAYLQFLDARGRFRGQLEVRFDVVAPVGFDPPAPRLDPRTMAVDVAMRCREPVRLRSPWARADDPDVRAELLAVEDGLWLLRVAADSGRGRASVVVRVHDGTTELAALPVSLPPTMSRDR